jgi:phosphate-selective porin OprO/OprP
VDLFNLELATILGSFSAQAEFTGSYVHRPGSGSGVARGGRDPFFFGGYGFVSYFLTGERRNYELGKGRFGRVSPLANFNPARGDWGAWEVAARFSYLDLTDRDIRGGEQWDVTAGLNWYLFPNLRFMLNYVHFDVNDRQTTPGAPDVEGPETPSRAASR